MNDDLHAAFDVM